MQFTVNGHDYATTKMRVLDQLNLTRRLAPAIGVGISKIGVSGMKDAVTEELTKEQAEERAIALVPIFLEVYASLSEDDANWITMKCLECVQRRSDQGYAFVARSGEIMFDDIELPEILQLIGHVIRENLASFFPQGGTNGSAPARQN